MKKFYPLGDEPTREEKEELGVKGSRVRRPRKEGGHYVMAVKADAFRPPKAGEWYLSGAKPTAYRAPNALHTDYRIMRLVRVKTTVSSRTREC